MCNYPDTALASSGNLNTIKSKLYQHVACCCFLMFSNVCKVDVLKPISNCSHHTTEIVDLGTDHFATLIKWFGKSSSKTNFIVWGFGFWQQSLMIIFYFDKVQTVVKYFVQNWYWINETLVAAPLALECEGSITERGAEGGGEAL